MRPFAQLCRRTIEYHVAEINFIAQEVADGARGPEIAPRTLGTSSVKLFRYLRSGSLSHHERPEDMTDGVDLGFWAGDKNDVFALQVRALTVL